MFALAERGPHSSLQVLSSSWLSFFLFNCDSDRAATELSCLEMHDSAIVMCSSAVTAGCSSHVYEFIGNGMLCVFLSNPKWSLYWLDLAFTALANCKGRCL